MSPPESSASETATEATTDNTNKASVEESLGEALAGVSLSNSNSKGGFSGSSGIASAPFAIAPGTNTNSSAENDGWGNFSPTEEAKNTAVDKSHIRNESLDLFLSKSPSQTLGEDVFKFSHTNLPALAEQEEQKDAFGMPKQPPISTQSFSSEKSNSRRKTDSPSCSVTGTTTSSRSVSPYNNNEVSRNNSSSNNNNGTSNNNIPAYLGSEQSTSASNGIQAHGSNPSLSTLDSSRTPYAKDLSQQVKAAAAQPSSFDPQYPPIDLATVGAPPPPPQLQLDPQQMANNGGQVLYMAMPSPDGRGQLLQPVQMMQLPGKPYTYVVQGQPPMDGQQNMMVLPPTQAGLDAAYGHDVRGRASDYSVDTHHHHHSGSGDMLSRPYGDDYISKPPSSPYQTDPAIASLYAAPQRPPLDALLGQIRRLSRDQVGCRLVQQALDEEGEMAATLILNEGLPFWGEAMVDPFGNYLFQKILEKVTPEERIILVKSVSARLVNASLNLHGTRSVQKVVELCSQDEQDGFTPAEGESAANILTKSLTPAAARLCIDSHGNHVIQRILLRLDAEHSQFVFDAVAASVGDVARHRHGCCVIQRCLDSPPSDARAHLVRCIVEKSLELMQDAYGNYVVQYVLDVCSDEDVQAVCESVVGKVNLLAIQKFSSNVMEKCLERCGDRVKDMYLLEMSDPERIRELMMDPFGNYVVQRALSVATHSQAIRLVEAMRPHLIATQTAGPNGQRNGGVRNTAGGRRIIAKICRRFPNFTLNPVGTQDELYSQNKGNHRYMNHHQQGPHGGHMPQQQQHQHHHHQSNKPMLASYAPVGPAMGAPMQQQQPLYAPDPRMAQGHMPIQQPQQQQHFSMGGGAGNGYYDHFANGHYPPAGM